MGLPMPLSQIALIVSEYDDAIAWYCGKMGFVLLEDTRISDTKRWVVVSPGDGGANLLLAKADTDVARAAVGNQSGGRVFLFFNTRQFDSDYKRLMAAGIRFLETPRDEAYGKVAVFEDLYGNKWDLIGSG
jgi:catechol 2,3-dioxygenase-like lactoylglutathione lyase family enzyme